MWSFPHSHTLVLVSSISTRYVPARGICSKAASSSLDPPSGALPYPEISGTALADGLLYKNNISHLVFCLSESSTFPVLGIVPGVFLLWLLLS